MFLQIGLKEEILKYQDNNGLNYNDLCSNLSLVELDNATRSSSTTSEQQGESSSTSSNFPKLSAALLNPSTVPERNVVSKDRRGPYHTLLKYGFHYRIDEIYNDSNMETLSLFLNEILPEGVGKRKWNNLVKGLPPSKFVTFSDEAFAMLVIENLSVKLLAEMKNPGLSEKERKQLRTRYTHGDCPGWTGEGLSRFVQLCEKVVTMQKDNINLKLKIDDIVQSRYGRKMKKREKRRFEDYLAGCRRGNEENEEKKLLEKRRLELEKANRYMFAMSMKGAGFEGGEIDKHEEEEPVIGNIGNNNLDQCGNDMSLTAL